MSPFSRVAPLALLLALGACKTTPSSDATVETTLLPPSRWYGNLTPTTERTAEIRYAGQSRVHGEVNVVRGRSADETEVTIRFAAPNSTISYYSWALHTGRCGSSGAPVAPINTFPQVQVRGDGAGDARAYIGMSLPESGNYHVNLYASQAAQLSDVVACANLRAERQKKSEGN